jgi:hypothetical protein
MPAFALAVVLYGLVFQGYCLPAAADILAKALKGNGDLVPSEQAS